MERSAEKILRSCVEGCDRAVKAHQVSTRLQARTGVRGGHQGSDNPKTQMKLPAKARGKRAGRRVMYLAIGSLISVLLVGCSLWSGRTPTDASHHTPPSSRKLTWAPHPCGDRKHACRTLYLQNTGSHQMPLLDNSTDYRIYLPTSGPLAGGITISGGRRVEIIGGEIDLTYPCSSDGSECIGIYIAKNSPGAVFVEGVWIHNARSIGRTCPGGASRISQTCSTGDGIDVNTADNGVINVNTITLENIRVDGISGCSGYSDHADVFQPYQAPDDTVQIDGMTGVTNCQGFTVDPDLAYSQWHTFPSSMTIKNANIEITSNPYPRRMHGASWWLTYGEGCQSGLVSLSNDYSSEPRTGLTAPSIWPNAGYHICGARYSHGVVSWRDARIKGSIRTGAPPGGDFVPPGAAGLGYLSPGYR